jgi:hypothetical protein
MNINRDDLNSLQSAYRTMLTESQETGYTGGMNTIARKVIDDQHILRLIQTHVDADLTTLDAPDVIDVHAHKLAELVRDAYEAGCAAAATK